MSYQTIETLWTNKNERVLKKNFFYLIFVLNKSQQKKNKKASAENIQLQIQNGVIT
jgi:hypothetical protein